MTLRPYALPLALSLAAAIACKDDEGGTNTRSIVVAAEGITPAGPAPAPAPAAAPAPAGPANGALGTGPTLKVEVGTPPSAEGAPKLEVAVTPLKDRFDGVSGAVVLNDGAAVQAKVGDRPVAFGELKDPLNVVLQVPKAGFDLEKLIALVVVNDGTSDEQKLAVDKRYLKVVDSGDGVTLNVTVDLALPGFSVALAQLTGGTLPAGYEAYDPVSGTVGGGPIPTAPGGSAVPILGAFTLTGPKTAISAEAPLITWQRSEGATAYNVVVATDLTCTNIFAKVDGVAALNAQVPGMFVEGTTYYVCVRATAVGSLARAAVNNGMVLVIDRTPPPDFDITGPSSPNNSTAPQASWQAAAGAASYRLVLDSDTACAPPHVQSYDNLTATSQALSTIGNGAYYVCVYARDEAGNERKGRAGTALPLMIDTHAPNQPPAPLAVNAGPIKAADLAFSWTNAGDIGSSLVQSYQVRVGQTPGGADLFEGSVGSDTQRTFTGAISGKTYYAMVQAIDGAGNVSNWSNISAGVYVDGTPPPALTTFTAAAAGPGSTRLTIVYPTPTTDLARVEIVRDVGTTAPPCTDTAKVVKTYTTFTNGTLGDAAGSATTYSYRACVYDSVGNVTASNVSTTATGTVDAAIFATSDSFTGDLRADYNGVGFSSGITGADYRCQHIATTAGFVGRWKALLSDEYINAKDRIQILGNLTSNGTTIKTTSPWDGNSLLVANPVRTETGAFPGASSSWAGTNANGTKNSGTNCTNWTVGISGTQGTSGRNDLQNSGWLYNNNQGCQNINRLLCISQPEPLIANMGVILSGAQPKLDIDFHSARPARYTKLKVFRDATAAVDCSGSHTLVATLTPPFLDTEITDPTGSAGHYYRACAYTGADVLAEAYERTDPAISGADRRMFLTSTRYTGLLGDAQGADLICASRATASARSGTWKAFISTTNGALRDRITLPGRLINTRPGVIEVIATDWLALWSGTSTAKPEYDEFGNKLTTDMRAWTGTTNSGSHSGTSCIDGGDSWFNAGAGANGTYADLTVTSSWINAGTMACNSQYRVLCIQQ